jgi:hypothetical protein
MHKSRLTSILLFSISTLLFTACGEVPDLDGVASSTGDFVYRNHNFGANRDAEYRKGVQDGCRTSDGEYTKNHALFKAENDYRAGWEHGRMHCKGTGQ